MGRDTRREGAKKVVGSGDPSRLTGQAFTSDAQFGHPQSEMAHRRGKSAGAPLDMNEADTVARMAEGSVRQLPVAVEGFSVEGFKQSEQISHGTFAVLHRFLSCGRLRRGDTVQGGLLFYPHRFDQPCRGRDDRSGIGEVISRTSGGL